MEKSVVTMMLARGGCLRLVVVTSDVSDSNNDCSAAVDVSEGVLTLLLDCASLLSLHLLHDVMMMPCVVVVVVVVVSREGCPPRCLLLYRRSLEVVWSVVDVLVVVVVSAHGCPSQSC